MLLGPGPSGGSGGSGVAKCLDGVRKRQVAAQRRAPLALSRRRPGMLWRWLGRCWDPVVWVSVTVVSLVSLVRAMSAVCAVSAVSAVGVVSVVSVVSAEGVVAVVAVVTWGAVSLAMVAVSAVACSLTSSSSTFDVVGDRNRICLASEIGAGSSALDAVLARRNLGWPTCCHSGLGWSRAVGAQRLAPEGDKAEGLAFNSFEALAVKTKPVLRPLLEDRTRPDASPDEAGRCATREPRGCLSASIQFAGPSSALGNEEDGFNAPAPGGDTAHGFLIKL